MKAKLNSTTIKKSKPEDKAYEIHDTEIKGFLLRVQPTGRMTFYFSYRNNAGKRLRIKIGPLSPQLTIAKARDKAQAFAGKVADGIDIQTEKVVKRKVAKDDLKNTLKAFVEDHYEPWAIANQKSGHETIKSIKRSFPHYWEKPLSDIKLHQVEKWRISKLEDGRKPNTINRIISALRGVLTKAVEWNAIQDHPLAKLKPLKVDEAKHVRYLSDDEETALYNALEERDQEIKDARSSGNTFRSVRGYELLPDISNWVYGDRLTPMVTLSLKTGIRRGEAFDLEWADINFKTKVLTIKGENAKSSKTRHIPLSPTALTALEAWKKQAPLKSGRVFPNDEGERLDNVNTAWRNLLEKAEIKNFRWHDMRHDFASKLVMKGVPLNTVRELCGHADLNTTLRYAHLAEDHKADAIALIG